MKTETHHFVVHDSPTPMVEVDQECGAVYVRFRRSKVVKTVTRPSRNLHIAVDLDAQRQVVGIEAVGVDAFSVGSILRMARVEAPSLDFSRVRYRATPPHPAPAALVHA